MDALAKLGDLYIQRDQINEQIQKVEAILGADPAEPTPKQQPTQRKCTNCGEPGHRSTTCQKPRVTEMPALTVV
jgi:Zinc knuckle